MYVVTFSTGNGHIEKEAKTEKELWRLICVYSGLKQKERERLFNEIKQKNGNL